MKSSDINIEKIRERAIREQKKNAERLENNRLEKLEAATNKLKDYFSSNTSVSLFLFGSILQTGRFNKYSDIDIAVQNYKGSRFELYCELEKLLNTTIDIVFLEKCDFKDEIVQQGLRII